MKFLVFLVSLSLASTTYGFNNATESLIDMIMENIFMENNRIPGVGMAVVQNQQVLMAKGYGFRNIAAGLPSNGDTLYSIGSITKVYFLTSMKNILLD